MSQLNASPLRNNPSRDGFEQTGETNLQRYTRSGTYYLRAKVRGQIVKESLRTKVLQTALQLRDRRLKELRGVVEQSSFVASVRGKFVFLNVGPVTFKGEFIASDSAQIEGLKSLMRCYGAKPMRKKAIRNLALTFEQMDSGA